MNQNYIFTITLYNRIRAADTPDRKERWIRTVPVSYTHLDVYKRQAFYPYGIVSTEYYPEACRMQSDVFSWGSDECSTAGTGTKYPIGTGLSDSLPK